MNILKRAVLIAVFATLAGQGYAFAQSPSRVTIVSGVLTVEKRMEDGYLAKPQPYVIMGTTWSPATRAPASGPNPLKPDETVDYGYFFDWAGREPQGHDVFNYWIRNEYYAHYREDIALMRAMNIKTVRVYNDFGDDPAVFSAILDEFYNNGIMVIVTLNLSQDELVVNPDNAADIDISERAHLFTVVDRYRTHPAILFWSIGNEWNFNKYYGNVPDLVAAAALTDRIARKIKLKDRFHPVGSCLGDAIVVDQANPCKPPEAATVAFILKRCPHVDIWGVNVYRGTSFHGIFAQWAPISSKPFYISEFGTDSLHTTAFVKFKPGDPCDYRITKCKGYVDENLQAATDRGLVREIAAHLAALRKGEQCQGGLVHEFNDELWKVGSYHTGLGGLIAYGPAEHSYDQYNCEGISIGESHPDRVANEEYFGMVDADRRPKQVFNALRDEFAAIDASR